MHYPAASRYSTCRIASSAGDVAADLLDRYLPRDPPGQKRGSIPYT